MATKRWVSINGQSLGILSPRDEEVYAVGKIAALAELREKVAAMSSWAIGENPNGHTALWVNKDDVLALIDGSV